jgi:hypothetical protein
VSLAGAPAPEAAEGGSGARPFIDADGVLVIPAGADARWRWWAREGMSLADVLRELSASRTVWARYLPDPYPEDLAREVYPLLDGK